MTDVSALAAGASRVSDPQLQAITSNEDVVRSRQLVRALAQQCGLSLVDQTKLVTAASELARNTLIHGGGGRLEATLLERAGRRGVALRFSDDGPGIADLELAMTDGWTSGGGLGLGLSGAKRLVDEFLVDSGAGRGTSVSVVKWTR
jgi:serine/threonine-protein kinase RsbT